MSSEGWKTYVFSEFVEINPTIKLDNSFYYSFVEMKDLDKYKKIVYPSSKRKFTGGSKFQNHDTLFARITPCLENGKICQVSGLESGVGFGSTEFLVFRGVKGVSDTEFIYYLSIFDEVRSFAEKNLIGTSGRQRINKEAFHNLELILPPLKIQSRITSILSSLDEKIELNRQANQTLEEMAQALFQEICIPKNGEFPEGWRVGKLGDIYKTTSGGTPSRTKMEYYENGSINWVKSKELGGFYVLETEEKITETALEKSSAKLLTENSILIAMYGATVAEISILGKPACCNQAICAILPNDNYPYSFVYEFLKNKREEIKSMAIGAAQQNISQVVINGIEMTIPSKAVLTKFHKSVEPVYKQIKNNIEKNQTLSALRDTLLPKLMRGEIEV